MSAQHRRIDERLLRFAAEVGAEDPVAVEGGRTRWSRGGAVADEARLVHPPTGIVSYQPAEMTVQVRAGTSVAELHAELAEGGQRTALPERGGTVGGALAVGEDDVCSLGVGRVRTAALQVRYVSADGGVVTGGGPTVKNVSGFDLPRLLVGSLGTLGLLGEVILRTNPLPQVSQWLVAADADPVAARNAVFAPGAVLWDGGRTWVQLEGHPPDVEAERRALGAVGTFQQTDGPPPLPEHRWSLRPSELHDLDRGQIGTFVASVGTGTVFAQRPQPVVPPEPAMTQLAARMKAEFDPTGRLNPGRDPAMP